MGRNNFSHNHTINTIEELISIVSIKFLNILVKAYLCLNIGQSIQAMIFDDTTDRFISKVKQGNITNLHVLGKVLHGLQFPSAQIIKY